MQTLHVDAATVGSLLAGPVAAPSIHNTQPWRFGLDPESRSVAVRADRMRTLPLTDRILRHAGVRPGAVVSVMSSPGGVLVSSSGEAAELPVQAAAHVLVAQSLSPAGSRPMP